MGDYQTDADLEPAARRLCARRGVDPDETFMSIHGQYRPGWRFFLEELRAHLEREQALRETDGGYQFAAIGYKCLENTGNVFTDSATGIETTTPTIIGSKP